MNRFVPRTAILAMVFICSLSTSRAQIRTAELGAQPSAVFVDAERDRVHVLTLGRDVDFDKIYEPEMGDILPQWFMIDPKTEKVVGTYEFQGFFNDFPIRVGVDRAHSTLYLPQMGRVRAFDYVTQTLLRDTVVDGRYSAVAFDSATGLLALSFRPSYSDPGRMVLVNPATRDTMGIFRTGPNPGMTVSRRNAARELTEFVTLYEGGAQGGLVWSSVTPDVFGAANGTPLGGGASHMVSDGGARMYVVLNGTHQLRVIDVQSQKEASGSPIDIGTTGFDGPRVAATQGGSVVYVGTYHGDVRKVDVGAGTVIDSLAVGGKVESMTIQDSLLFVARKYRGTSYDPDTLVMVVNLNTWRVVDSIPVGEGPAAVFTDTRGNLQVLGYGASDSLGWWMTFDRAGYARTASRNLYGHLGFPFRWGYDFGNDVTPNSDTLFVTVADTLWGFPAANPSAPGRVVYTDSTATGDLVGASDPLGRYIAVNELPKSFSPDPGFIHVIDRRDGSRVAKVRAGSFLTMAVPYPALPAFDAVSFYMLSEGNFGSPSSTLGTMSVFPDGSMSDTLGATPNHILLNGSHAYVTVNGSHSVAEIDLDSRRVVKRIGTGTESFDGPRETLLLPNGSLAVTTYAGDLRIIKDGAVVRTFKTGDNAEGAVLLDGKLFVANPYHDDFTVDSTLAIIDLASAGVRRESREASATRLEGNAPNPASTSTTIRFSVAAAADVMLQLHAIDGREVATPVERHVEAGSYGIDVPVGALQPGTYVYTLRVGDEIFTRTMQVVR